MEHEFEYVLCHHGVKGQKWGVRRYQKKDGSLTMAGRRRLKLEEKTKVKNQKTETKARIKQQKEEAVKQKAEAEAQKKKLQEEETKRLEQERIEQLRTKVLKSTNAQEIYANRNLLSTAEINERLNRIDTERRLGSEAEKSKVTFGKKVQKAVNRASDAANTIETAYQITQKPFFKALAKQLKGETVTKTFDINKAVKDVDKLTDKQVADLRTRITNTNMIEKLADEIVKRRAT